MSSDTRRQLNRDGIVGIAALCVSGLYWLGANAIPRSSLIGNGVGANAIPSALAIALALFSIILVARTAIAKARLGAAEREDDENREEARGHVRKHLRAAGMMGIGLGFLVLLEPLGYIPSIVALALATAIYNGQPASRWLVMFSVVLALLFYGIFVVLLHIPLPTGVWLDFLIGR